MVKTGGRRMNTQVMTFENQEFGKVRTVKNFRGTLDGR